MLGRALRLSMSFADGLDHRLRCVPLGADSWEELTGSRDGRPGSNGSGLFYMKIQ